MHYCQPTPLKLSLPSLHCQIFMVIYMCSFAQLKCLPLWSIMHISERLGITHTLPLLSLLVKLERKVCAKVRFKLGWTCKKYRNKVEMKTYKKTTLVWNDDRKERQEDYPTSSMCFYTYYKSIPTWTSMCYYTYYKSIPTWTREKVCKSSFQVGLDLRKVQKQGMR